MKASMFTAGKAASDRARTRNVYLKDGGVLVGRIFEPDGKGAGYKFLKLGRDHPSAKRYRTIRECKEGLGASL